VVFGLPVIVLFGSYVFYVLCENVALCVLGIVSSTIGHNDDVCVIIILVVIIILFFFLTFTSFSKPVRLLRALTKTTGKRELAYSTLNYCTMLISESEK